jgi:hypothetical protein
LKLVLSVVPFGRSERRERRESKRKERSEGGCVRLLKAEGDVAAGLWNQLVLDEVEHDEQGGAVLEGP